MALHITTIEVLMEAREARLRGGTSGYLMLSEAGTAQMMQPGINKGRKLGKRPVSRQGTLNQQIIARSPGSRHKGFDFVKAVYADKTGQEQEDWTHQF